MQKLLFLDDLKTGKNLLAFSHGTDSTALFYMLLENKIDFDLAIVDYSIREQSKEEVKSAKELAEKYNKAIYIKTIKNNIKNDFENTARKIRYDFFEEIISTHKYTNLILAHQLNDAFEWFLMRMSKGAGLSNMLMKPKLICEINYQNNITQYTKLRPMYMIDKELIDEYLKTNKLKYFFDESNDDKKYFRNKIRHEFASNFLKEFKLGVMSSFKYLLSDESLLQSDYNKYMGIAICNNLNSLDKAIKSLGYITTKSQKDEIIKQLHQQTQKEQSMVIGGKIGICIWKEKYLTFKYTPKTKVFNKDFKELCRRLKIPQHLRIFINENNININDFLSFLQ